MYSERLQILVSPEQRRRLEAEAKRKKTSVAALIRDAIDARIEPISADQRADALDRLKMRRIAFVPLEGLNALIDAREDVIG